ncbi:MAG: peptide chain release factor N(5)-glutamine methyltransferase [Chromatiaceae bacterium]|nr:MAG: peptide chain release factor N(5)-glutamine methyltransferase [Chromatiaceae bacterium]
MPIDIATALRDGSARLRAAGQSAPRLEAELLLGAVTGRTRAGLLAWSDQPLRAAAAARYAALVARRAAGEPLAYLTGRQAFRGLELMVGPAVLIPRPETELLVDLALARLPATPLRLADLGTGSGAIAIALALARPAWTLLAVERSAAALALAIANAHRLGAARLLPLQGDWLCAIGPGSLDALVANPPYVRAGDPHLRQGDLRFEPGAALVAGADGLAAIRAILAQARRCLRPGGWLALEHGWDQGSAVRALARRAGLRQVVTHRDFAGHGRVTSGWCP